MVDPQQRLLLEATANMLTAAAEGPVKQQLQPDTGVFVGISTPDYSDMKKMASPIGVYSATGAILGIKCGT